MKQVFQRQAQFAKSAMRFEKELSRPGAITKRQVSNTLPLDTLLFMFMDFNDDRS